MKFTLSWLKDHLETAAPLEEIAVTLTRLGLEVEGIENPAERLAAVRVAHVLNAQPHPNADKLRVCSVDTGEGAPVQVVCGAPNARAGMKVAFAPPGMLVPGSGITLKVAEIRGVQSSGMMCSARELELGEDHEGILDLPADAPVGVAYVDYAGLNDPVIDIALTPDRQDCLGVAGIARDLAAAGLGTLKTPKAVPPAGRFDCPVRIETHDAAGCPTFLGQVVRGVSNGAAPDWMRQRLKAIGLRPISALVDISQYVMIDRARPLHIYDLAKIGDVLMARPAKEGESIAALNGKTYALQQGMLVISDAQCAHGIAGIMGGEDSACTAETTDILIECAHFDPVRIGETGRALNLLSDARTRFERGVDPGGMTDGLALATQLVVELCGGSASHVATGGAVVVPERTIAYRPARCASLGGLGVPADQQADALGKLGFAVAQTTVASWTVAVPSWRRDVHGEADLVEEVLRVVGYDAIPPVPLPRRDGVARPVATPEQARIRHVRRAVAARGFHEAVTWSFISPAEAASVGGGDWTLDNPISADLAVMRPSLLPGLVRAAARNRARNASSVRLFELGMRYFRPDPQTSGVEERPTLALIATGARTPRHWRAGKAAGFDVYDAKSEALAALEALGFTASQAQITTDAPDWYHPGRSGVMRLGQAKPLAHFGELHPRLLKALDASGPMIGVELFIDAVPVPRNKPRARPAFAPSDLQPVERDFAFLVAADAEAGKLVRAITGADRKLITAVDVFDVFTGEGVPEGHKSIALCVTLQPRQASLTDDDLNAVSQAIIKAAQTSVGATLRS